MHASLFRDVVLFLSGSMLAASVTGCTQGGGADARPKGADAIASGRDAWSPNAADGKDGKPQSDAPAAAGKASGRGKANGQSYDDGDYDTKSAYGPGQHPSQSPGQAPVDSIPNLTAFPDDGGFYATYSLDGAIDL